MAETATGAKLKRLREERGFSRQRVARHLDISERTVIRHEDGTTPLRRVHLAAYAEFFGVPVSYFDGATA